MKDDGQQDSACGNICFRYIFDYFQNTQNITTIPNFTFFTFQLVVRLDKILFQLVVRLDKILFSLRKVKDKSNVKLISAVILRWRRKQTFWQLPPFLTLLHPAYFIPGRSGGGGWFRPPPSLIFLKCGFLGFWWTTFKQYIIVGPMQKETVRSSNWGFYRHLKKNPQLFEKILSQQKSS